jgi:hypothetical protein
MFLEELSADDRNINTTSTLTHSQLRHGNALIGIFLQKTVHQVCEALILFVVKSYIISSYAFVELQHAVLLEWNVSVA